MEDLRHNIKRVALVPLLSFALPCGYLGYWHRGGRAARAPNNSWPRSVYAHPARPIIRRRRRAADGRGQQPGQYAHLSRRALRVPPDRLQRAQWPAMGPRDAFLGIGKHEKPWAEFIEGPRQGNDVVLTLTRRAEVSDPAAARAAGAVVALSAHTGAYDHSERARLRPGDGAESDWDYRLPGRPDRRRIARCRGCTPPGAHILTAATCSTCRVQPDTTFRCTGSYAPRARLFAVRAR